METRLPIKLINGKEAIIKSTFGIMVQTIRLFSDSTKDKIYHATWHSVE